MKVIINKCYGGWGISIEAYERYMHKLGKKPYDENRAMNECVSPYNNEEYRTDPVLVLVVQELGRKANGAYAKLKVVEIPDDVEWEIHDYDGVESVHEVHRVWM